MKITVRLQQQKILLNPATVYSYFAYIRPPNAYIFIWATHIAKRLSRGFYDIKRYYWNIMQLVRTILEELQMKISGREEKITKQSLVPKILTMSQN